MSDPFFSSYTTIIDQLFAANGQSALSIDDPTLRRGVELTDLATHQIEYVARLTRILLLAGVSEGQRLDTSEEIAEAAGLLGQIENGVEQVRELGTGRYQAAAQKVDEEFAASGFTGLAQSAIDTGQVQVAETMASLSREDDEGYNGFRTSVNDGISARADELNDAASANRIRYLLLGVLAGIGVAERLEARSRADDVTRLAEASDVALGTLYKYFRSKEDILLFAVNEEAEKLEVGMVERPVTGDTPNERLRAFFSRATRGPSWMPAETVRALGLVPFDAEYDLADRFVGGWGDEEVLGDGVDVARVAVRSARRPRTA